MSLTEAQARFVELERRRKSEIKEFYEQYDQAIADVEAEIGMDGHFQDQAGVVHKVVVPKGTFTAYKHVGIASTRNKKLNEKQGSLSLTDARALGYEVE